MKLRKNILFLKPCCQFDYSLIANNSYEEWKFYHCKTRFFSPEIAVDINGRFNYLFYSLNFTRFEFLICELVFIPDILVDKIDA